MNVRAIDISKTAILANGETLPILQQVSINIESGEILGILGVSGSGKTTLLGLLAGLDLPSQGEIFWDHNNIGLLSEEERATLRLKSASFIFQNFELLASYTAIENVLLPLELVDKKEAYSLAEKYLIEVGLKNRLHHYPNQLSGGEQQRVAIARAFAAEPKILFADEPTGNLDQKTGAEIIQLIIELNKKYKSTIVCVTHDPALSGLCQRTLYLSEGKIVE